MELTDHWHLHRERILQAASFALFAAAVLLVLSQRTGNEDPQQIGHLFGVAFRYVFLGVVGAGLINYLVDRFYWYDESANWRSVAPEYLVGGGAVALALAVLLGAG